MVMVSCLSDQPNLSRVGDTKSPQKKHYVLGIENSLMILELLVLTVTWKFILLFQLVKLLLLQLGFGFSYSILILIMLEDPLTCPFYCIASGLFMHFASCSVASPCPLSSGSFKGFDSVLLSSFILAYNTVEHI